MAVMPYALLESLSWRLSSKLEIVVQKVLHAVMRRRLRAFHIEVRIHGMLPRCNSQLTEINEVFFIDRQARHSQLFCTTHASSLHD